MKEYTLEDAHKALEAGTLPGYEKNQPEYTLGEKIAALRKLGAIIHSPEAGYEYAEINLFMVAHIHKNFADGTLMLALEAAHDFLRTDESAWMAMDALFGESKLGQEEFDEHAEFHYEARGYESYANLTRQEAVYDCYMQFIRMELKTK